MKKSYSFHRPNEVKQSVYFLRFFIQKEEITVKVDLIQNMKILYCEVS